MFKKFIAAGAVAVVMSVGAAGAASAVPIDPSPTHPARVWHPSTTSVKYMKKYCRGSALHRSWYYQSRCFHN